MNINNIIISNTCVGQFIMKKKNIFPYNNPLIGSLIPNDYDYIKLINNIDYYITLNPILGEPNSNSLFSLQNNGIYYKHESIKTPYPVIYLGDIEIHFIHEIDSTICVEKFIRRLNRFREIIKNDHKIIITLSFSELINEHFDKKKIINKYFDEYNRNLNINIEKYFIGPPEYNNSNKNYINIDKWKNINLDRNSSHVYNFNDQPFSINIFSEYIKSVKKIVFLADYCFYKNSFGKTSYNFINNIAKSNLFNITIFYTDEDILYVKNKINQINPDLIIVFEINAFQEQTKKFNFIFELEKLIYLFLDDSYYISSITDNCIYTPKVNGIIFWYKSDAVINSYKKKYPDKNILNLSSRFINTSIYKDYELEKNCDILLYGTRHFKYNYKNEQIDSIQNWVKKYEQTNNTIINKKISFYPLREKIESILQNNLQKYRVRILPEGTINNSNIANEDLAKLINKSYLTVACSSIADVLLHKHLEIAASKSVILGSYPSDYQDTFEGNVVEVNEFMSDDEIINIIDKALADKKNLERMSNRIYEKVHQEHNLDKALESFNKVFNEVLNI
jgi:uncharacterized protein (DUF1919 family)